MNLGVPNGKGGVPVGWGSANDFILGKFKTSAMRKMFAWCANDNESLVESDLSEGKKPNAA